MTIKYEIRFFDYWLCGTGISAGFDVDERGARDSEGFPYVPGTTIKGLFREAAEILEELEAGDQDGKWDVFITEHFGPRSDHTGKERSNHLKWDMTPILRKRKTWFSNAELPAGSRKILVEDKDKSVLFKNIASTAIDEESGTAKEHSLRRIEAVVPLILEGEISSPGKWDDGDQEKMEKCMKWIKRLGSCRTRGLGRCRIRLTGRIENEGDFK